MRGQPSSPETHERPHNRVYRSRYRDHYGSGPYECHLCGEAMVSLEVVHHLDEDPWNNDIENLVAMHITCHNREHHVGITMSEDSNRQRSASLKTTFADKPAEFWEMKAAQARRVWTGRKHKPENLAKITEAAQRRSAIKVSCVKCHRVITASCRNVHLAAHERKGD